MPKPINNSRIGCHCWGTKPASILALEEAARLGVGWVRATRPMQLDVVADGPGKFDWIRGGEQSVDLAVAKGMSVMGILDGRWGNETMINRLPWCSPVWKHLDLWCEFVAAAVNHYKDRVHHWEVINEPPFFWFYPPPPGESFHGANSRLKRPPISTYASLLKATAKTVRECDPTAAIIVGAGFSDGHFLEQLYERGCRDSFDVASVHYLPCQHPDHFERAYRRVRHVMAKHGDEKKPLWDTENGPGGAIIGQGVKTPSQYQAFYHVYRHCFAHQFGLERYFWFNPVLMVEGSDIAVELRDKKGGYSEPYQAMAALIAQLGDGPLLGHQRLQDEVHLYVFDGPRGPVSVVWTTAAANAKLPGGATAFNYLGAEEKLPAEFPLTGSPLYLPGDLRERDFSVTLTGPRETIRPCRAGKVPTLETPTLASIRVRKPLALDDAAWDKLAPFAPRASVAVPAAGNHFAKLPTPLPAELRLAHDDNHLYLRAHLWDDRLNPKSPSGLVLFALRDSNPAVSEWPHFLNGYALFGLDVSKHGPRFLRFEHLFPDDYSAGVVPTVPVASKTSDGALVVTASIPWREIGPCRPGKNQPFFATFNFSRSDELLDVPSETDPAEWPHNFIDPFIVTPPSLHCWIEFP